ncbi:MAG: hypothetical protein H7839_03730 [Magnetococcus sp. YQC-5]
MPATPTTLATEQNRPAKQAAKGADAKESSIPSTVKVSPFLPKEGADQSLAHATYSVVVTEVPVQEVLFALARDAHLNVDIVPGITGNVTLNALDQTLPKILERIAHQTNIRYQIKDNVLSVEPDLPFRRTYRVDYVSTAREMQSDMAIASTVTSAGSNAATFNNSSNVKLSASSTLDFWKNLIANLQEILNEEKKGTGAEAAEKNNTGQKKIIWNESTGVISVMANTKQHAEIQEFIDRVVNSAQRQVLIEATVAKVELNDEYQSGIDWNLIKSNGAADKGGPGVTNQGNQISLLSNRIASAPFTVLTLNETKIPFLTSVLGGRDISATLRLLSTFGNAKVLSSPRLTVMNNQTAILRVTTNEVYFSATVTPGGTTSNTTPTTVSTTTTQTTIQIHNNTVPIGFFMQVTPQISSSGVITLNIRPTLQQIDRWITNPDPNLRVANVPTSELSKVPVIKVQEMDSVLRIPNGQVAVMGGLMENSRTQSSDGIPMLSDIPIVGNLFSYRDAKTTKSELVVFLRPVITDEPRNLMNSHDQKLYMERDTPIPNNRTQDKSIL